MKKILFPILVPLFAMLPLSAGIELKDAVIIHPDIMMGWEKDAVSDLKTSLEQISGHSYRILPESEQPAQGVKIFVGNTNAVAKLGINVKEMAPEQFRIKTAKDAVYITGGTPTGTSYGVSTFLQDNFGVYWLDYNCPVHPKNSNPGIDDQDKSGKPDILDRDIYNLMLSSKLLPEAKTGWDNYYRRNRIQWQRADRNLPGYRTSFGVRQCHTFFEYVPPQKYFKEHPEYYSMQENGKRSWFPTGQLCPTNKEMREVAFKFLVDLIKKERAAHPNDYPTCYELSQEDNTYYICKCPECLKMVKKYGGENALILDFTNEIATKIKALYPDVHIRTFAYTCTEKPLKDINPVDNVIVRYCDLYGFSNHMYPLEAPCNKERFDLYNQWIGKNENLELWDYILPLSETPLTAVDSIIADMRYFKKTGLKRLFMESEYNFYLPQTFHSLQYFLQAQMMFDSSQDAEKLIEIFMNGYYGAAAPEMKAYLALLRKVQREIPTAPEDWRYKRIAHIKPEFLSHARKLLTDGLNKVKDNKEIAGRVARELASVDFASFQFYRNDPKKNAEFGKLQDEFEQAMHLHFDTLPLRPEWKEPLLRKLKEQLSVANMKFTDLPLEIAQLPESRYLCLPYIYQTKYLHGKFVEDPDSSQPQSVEWIPPANLTHKLPFSIGVYAQKTKKIVALKITNSPEDEKYHWYKIGEFEMDPSSLIWATDWHIGFNLKDFYTSADGFDFSPNRYDIWVSMKLQGPAYVPGSKKENALRMDRALLVKKF